MSTLTFGKYIVTKTLGRGGMAEVYLARDPVLERYVAIKVIYPHLAADPGFEERFRREAKLVAALRHAHIVQLHDFDVAANQPFMVMEYLGGGSLKDRLAALRGRGTTMPLAEIAHILEPIASALDYAHAHGTIHRDVKPANILFTSTGDPVLSDFGIAKIVGEAAQISITGSTIGSPAYMSPEQADNKAVDARSDLYSLGVVVYEMASGRVPFHGDSPTAVLMQHITASPPPPRQFNANIPEPVQAVILKALAKNPAARFVSATELARAFSAALQGHAPVSDKAIATGAPTLVEPSSDKSVASPTKLPSSRTNWLMPVSVGTMGLTIIGCSLAIFLILLFGSRLTPPPLVANVTGTTTLSAMQTPALSATAQSRATATAQARVTATAQARATVTMQAIVTTVNAATQSAKRIFLAQEGTINGEDTTIEKFHSNTQVRNFVTEAWFYNPADRAIHAWDYGFGFRDSGSTAQYRLIVESDGDWRLIMPTQAKADAVDAKVITRGTLKNLDVSANGANDLRLIVQDKTAFFFVNDVFVATLDVSEKNSAGEVWLSTGFTLRTTFPGLVTRIKNFTVSELP